MWRVQTENDHSAFSTLVERWQERIRALCIRMTGNQHTSDDLVQETFARVFQKRAAFRGDSKFSTWVWRIALNLCYDELRRLQRRQEHSLDDEDGDNENRNLRLQAIDFATPNEHVQQQEEAEMVRGALMCLPELYRSVLVLRHYEGLKLREIAEILEVPEGTVNSRMAEGLSRLARSLEPQLHKHQKKAPPSNGGRPKEILTL